MPHRSKNVVIWNSLIRAYAWNGPFEEAIALYYKMLGYGITPNRFTFPFVLKACSALKEVDGGREIHFDIKRLRLESNVYVSTALVDFYAKCGCLDDAKEMFDKMPKRDVVAWNSMISGFSLHEGSYDEVVRLLVEMQNDMSPNSSTIVGVLPAVAQVNSLRHGKEIHGFCVRMGFVGDVVVGTGILDVYGKCQRIDYARRIFDMMGIVKNEVTWSAMAGAYVVCNYMREALELFCQLLMLKDDGIVLSAVTLATVTGVCAKLTDLSLGSCLHCYAIKSGFVLDLMVGNTLLSMYAKCGIINGAMRFFNEMEKRDAVSYTAIISGYVQNGNSEEGLRMFLEMQCSGINPEKATMASVLSACSHLAALHYGSCSHCLAIVVSAVGKDDFASFSGSLVDTICIPFNPLGRERVSICSLNNVQAQHFIDNVKSHKNGASLGIKLSTTVSRTMAEDGIQRCQVQKDKIKYCSVLYLANRDMSRRKRLLRLRGTVAANMRIYVPVNAVVVRKDGVG
ncbi:hypothetical protein SADUNF_Sadunf03G0004200 [Salix dunnii]|uniref:Pentatricopeptide repeat-containing protein n=1 Tax=Salix dunnii TaxID=1413687 RepID=A0A835KFK2_9ROSI|nr:hypothetical protein SADUNF_Sadunf03G0004200 [Salix dunnii]